MYANPGVASEREMPAASNIRVNDLIKTGEKRKRTALA
jgi:hypothetical protein